ncbi:Oxidoreductase [uncultured Woeseiaceae bacterium]|uniref:Oxidoreductase n=1 Tax=uncultured Woeseiaceae bacterium TaxID=1983305 RepID=A0A7D9D1W8_9GAMM|nr:Oxidoreductase [uncultured Woeseiaceae bacterium]
MITRREYLKNSVLAGAALSLSPSLLQALEGDVITRAIPSTGEEIPIVGLGSSATFRTVAQSDDVSALRDVLRTLMENGGSVFDTAPGYGASEEVAGGLVQDLDATQKVFWATKVNVAGRGGGSADPDNARAQIERSFQYIGKDPIDLIQVHNLGDVPTQLSILKDLKEEGRVRYIGVTFTGARRYQDLAQVMREEPLDFIGVDYAVDNTESAELILPLAQDRGIAVLSYVPFGRTRLWRRVSGREVPEWAAEFGASSWGQFFIKYCAAHPAVTAVTPATSKAKNMLDNIGAAYGELPDEATRRKMEALVESLPAA